MQDSVLIPDVPRDDRIGSVFNQLFKVIEQTKAIDNNIDWNFSNGTFFHPFFLAPLAIYKDTCNKNIVCSHLSDRLKGYFNVVHFENVYNATNLISQNALRAYLQRSYILISRFAISNGNNVDRIEEILQGIMERQSRIDHNMRNPISSFLSELIDNICEHSESEYGYLFSQKVRTSLYVIIADSGRTIYRSYVDRQKYLNVIGQSEAKAIKIANEGYSTKDRPAAENRGFGLSKSRAMINGLGGAFFMLSGRAFYRHEHNDVKIANIPEQFRWNGTIILVRIPLKAPSGFCFYKYVE